MKAVNSTSVGAGGRRHVSKQPRAFNYSDNSPLWDKKRSMSEQLREERRILFGDSNKEQEEIVQPAKIVPIKKALEPLKVKTSAADTKGWLTRHQAAKELGVSIWLIANWSLDVPLRYVQIGKKYYFDPQSIAEIRKTEWYKKHRNRAKYGTLTPEEKKARDYEKSTAWRKKNPEKYKLVHKRWYQKNREKCIKHQQEYEQRKKHELIIQQSGDQQDAG